MYVIYICICNMYVKKQYICICIYIYTYIHIYSYVCVCVCVCVYHVADWVTGAEVDAGIGEEKWIGKRDPVEADESARGHKSTMCANTTHGMSSSDRRTF